MLSQTAYRWLLLSVTILAIILVPFLLFGAQLEGWTEDFIHSEKSALVAGVLGLLLATDILLPVPSSVISTAAGFAAGFVGGLFASTVGMTVSCVLGYWLGAKFGRPMADRLVGSGELERLEGMSRRLGDWVIIVSRPVPVLAEASILFAGISQTPFVRFFLLCVLSNLGISAVYAAVGAFSASVNSFLLAFAGAILVPAAGMLVMRRRN